MSASNNPDCPACLGSGIITWVMVYTDTIEGKRNTNPNALDPRPLTKDYPCPECTRMVPVEIAYTLATVDEVTRDDPGYIDYLKRDAACQMGAFLGGKDFIASEIVDDPTGRPRLTLRSEVIVVDPKHRGAVERGKARAQLEVLERLHRECTPSVSSAVSDFDPAATFSRPEVAIDRLIAELKEKLQNDNFSC